MKKCKEKKGRGEVDRLKHAMMKKRRIEKALAKSAAIRSLLEKKKQKQLEEQQRIEEDAAALAEAFALRVVVGENADEPQHFMSSNGNRYNSWDYSGNSNISVGYHSFAKCPIGGISKAPDVHGPACDWNNWCSRQLFPPCIYVKGIHAPSYAEESQGADLSANVIATQAFSSLRIAEGSDDA